MNEEQNVATQTEQVEGQKTYTEEQMMDLVQRETDRRVSSALAKQQKKFEEKMAESDKYDAVICLGAVIKGSTAHFDYVCAEASKGIAMASLETGKPVIFGVLTTDTIEQAIERAGTKAGNKGFDVASTAIEMVNLMNNL